MTLPLRERKKARTAIAIEQAATLLFESQGYEATTLEQIAAAAEIHKQTILRYFKTKEDVAFARRNRLFAEFEQSLAKRQGSVLDHWRSHIAETVQAASESGRLRRHFQFLASDERLYAYQLRLNQKHQDALANAFSEEAGMNPSTDVFSHILAAALVAGNADIQRMTMRNGHDAQATANALKVIDVVATLRRDSLPLSSVNAKSTPKKIGSKITRKLPTMLKKRS
jgi:AcrR family transcriptional regulator